MKEPETITRGGEVSIKMENSVRWVQRVYRWAAVYGFIVLGAMLLLGLLMGRDISPPITYPEHFYGFVGLALVFQVIFLVVASDPVRFRPIMPACILEKLVFPITIGLLFLSQPVSLPTAVFASIDLSLGLLFAASFLRTRP